MKKPPSLRSIQQVARKLFDSENEQERFIDSIVNPSAKPGALLWLEDPVSLAEIETIPSPDFFPSWITLVSPESTPGKLKEHNIGKYYCLDSSSVFAMLPLLKISDELQRPVSVIDLCSSPGGKSIFAFRALKPDNLICNEVVGNRIPALLSNLKRCGLYGSIVTQSDPSHLAASNPNTADVVIVDAPCSGQSLLAKSDEGLGCFSKPVINANVGRQRRILAEASKLLRPGGYLLYSTCTFSVEENERNVLWFKNQFPNFTEISSGRMWPADGLGAGSFHSLLKKTGHHRDAEIYDFDTSSVKHWVVDSIQR